MVNKAIGIATNILTIIRILRHISESNSGGASVLASKGDKQIEIVNNIIFIIIRNVVVGYSVN